MPKIFPKIPLKIPSIFLKFVALFTFITCFVDLFLIFTFQNWINSTFIEIILATNTNETKDFFDTYFNVKVVILLGSFVLFSLLFWLLPALKFPLKQTKSFLAKYKISLIFFLFLAIASGIKLTRVDSAFDYLRNVDAFRWIEGISSTIIQNKQITQYQEITQALNENLSKPYKVEVSKSIPKVILILGESTQRNYMSLYGYALPTTPNLERLRNNGNLFVFNDVISPHAHTNLALIKVLTFSRYENASTPWFMQQNLVDVMNLSGYESIWLSNQEAISIWGNAPEAISKRAKHTRFSTYDGSYNSGILGDEVLLKIFEEEKTKYKTKEKMFYIFHLMGTHLAYKYRYPASFSKFSSNDISAISNDLKDSTFKPNKKQLEIKAFYANAVLYNDFIVASIMEKFSNEEAIIFYLSDHGDEVYDFRDFLGHSDSMASRFMTEIPFMIYVSDSFKKVHPEVIKKIKGALNRAFMSDDFIHSFFDLLGIKTQDNIENASIFSANFNATRPRIFGKKDYDKELKTQAQVK